MSEEEFVQGDKTQAILTKDLIGKMVTAEFQMQGFIPFNVSLEVKDMEYLNEDALGLNMVINKELVN